MKKIFLFFAILFSLAANAQVSKVSLQASGLTCSMCSNAINKALHTLDFVQTVNADIKTYTFEILFKPGAGIDFDMIRKKVENAGFTVTGFVVTIAFNNVQLVKDKPVTIGDHTFLFVHPNAESINGVKQVTLLGKGFVSTKQYKTNELSALPPHIYYATL